MKGYSWVLTGWLMVLPLSVPAATPGNRLTPPSRLKPPSRLTAGGTASVTAGRGVTLCHNGGFDAPENPLDGWMIDYAWTGNSYYVNNKSRVQYLPSYGGRSGVMHLNGRAGETKVESLPIPLEHGARYRCTIEYKSTAAPHIYFAGYKWKPGIRPYHDKPIHLGDLRMIYKSTFRNHKITKKAGGWKSETFEFPMKNASELSLKHLKYVRFFTVYFILTKGAKGEAWIDKVTVTRIN